MGIKSVKISTTIKDQVYDLLKENILSGDLKPGERIQEVQIADKLNVSRSPVRNAINKLIGEGFLESIPNKSVCVRKFTHRDINESYDFRLIIEKYAVEKVVENMNDEIADRLRTFRQSFLDNSKIEKLTDYLKVDADFHKYLVQVSGNKFILEALDKVSMMISPFRLMALSLESRFMDSVEEHTTIIDNLLKGDKEAAIASCENHLTSVKEEIIQNIIKFS